jgi:D-threo-aldose 1-dehydrogenase
MVPTTNRRPLGCTGLEVTCLGLGGAPLGDFYERIPEPRAEATIGSAYAAGVRLFDTSPAYGLGLSEHRFGRVLRALPDHDFVLSTKVGRYLLPEGRDRVNRYGFKGGLNMRLVTDYGYEATMRAVEQSFQRMGIEQIDVLLIHDLDRRTHGAGFERLFAEAMDGAYRALVQLRKEGTVRAVGLGVHEIEVCLRAARAGDFDCFMLAGPYTLLDQSAGASLLPLCAARGISVLLGGPFASGILATGPVEQARYMYRPASPEVLDRVRRIVEICECHNVALPAAALRFPLRHPAVASVVAGAVSPEEVTRNIALMEVAIPPALWEDLATAGLLQPS